MQTLEGRKSRSPLIYTISPLKLKKKWQLQVSLEVEVLVELVTGLVENLFKKHLNPVCFPNSNTDWAFLTGANWVSWSLKYLQFGGLCKKKNAILNTECPWPP